MKLSKVDTIVGTRSSSMNQVASDVPKALPRLAPKQNKFQLWKEESPVIQLQSMNFHLEFTANPVPISKTGCLGIKQEIKEHDGPCPFLDGSQEIIAIDIAQDNGLGYELSGALHGSTGIMTSTVSEKKKISCSSEHVNWLSLPSLVVWQIWKSLHNDADRVKMRILSSEWHMELPKLMAPRPWVVGSKMKDGIFHCVDKNRLEELRLKCKVPEGFFSGSSGDYLVSESNTGCSLWNPSNNMVLPLPFKSCVKTVMSGASDPMAFCYSSGRVIFSYGRPTEPRSWKNVVCIDRTIQDICHCGEEFYAITGFFRLFKLDQDNAKMVVIGPVQRSDDIIKLLADGRSPDHILLANLNEELLVIALGRNLHSVGVFKVVWIDEKTPSFLMIHDIGGWSVFLGRNQSIALQPRDFPGINGNRLYLAIEPVVDIPQTVQVYCVETRTVDYADYPSDKLGIPFFYFTILGVLLYVSEIL